MSDKKLYEPGEKPGGAGEYLEVGPRGGKVPKPRQVTITPDDGHLPPTSQKGNNWIKKGKKQP